MNDVAPLVTYAYAGPLALGGVGNIAYEGLQSLLKKNRIREVYATHCRDGLPVSDRARTLRLASVLGRFMHAGRAFDWLLSRRLAGPGHLHAWCMPGRRSVDKARALGMKVVVEHASTHPLNFLEQVNREYETFGVKRRLPRADFEAQLAMIEAADAVVLPSEQVRASFLARGYRRDNLHVIPFGVHAEVFDREPQRGDTFRFLFVGQVSLRKGVQYALAAWKKLRLPDAEFVFVGPVLPDAEALVAAHRDDPGLRFAGMDQQPHRQYRAAHACVFPSVEEGSALVSYEAQAAGLPLIATPEVGAMMTDEREGLIVPSRDVDALAEAMRVLYEDGDMRATMGARGRKNVESYPWSRYSDGILAVHDRLAAAGA